MTTKLFSELGISPEVLKAIDRLGFEQASPIQAEAIPVLLQGHDIVGQSQTGSGKTAAFAVPAVEKVDPQQRAVQVLILCPTRELAVQVSEEVHKLAFFKRGIHALPIYGGQSYERQFFGLKQGAQIVIGTPGRVMDHMRRGTLRLDTVKMAILDEADVMLDMGFREDIEFILQAVPATRQTVFFCATMPPAIRELIERYARQPQNIRIEHKTVTVPTVEQVYYEVDRRFKIELLTRLIDLHDLKLGIIFCNTKRMVDDLVDHLNAQGYSADRLHGDMSQTMRDRVMHKFRKSGLEFLVATDVAARGIDVDDVQVVFNYDLPYDVEDYVHRIGRTGRAGRSGRAISFVAGREVFQIRHIERYTNTRIQRGKVPTASEVEEARANVFLDKLRATLQTGDFKRQDHLIGRLLEEGFTSTDIASALLHHLQGTEAPPPTPPPREVPAPRSERPTFREARPDRGPERFARPQRAWEDRPPRTKPKAASPPAARPTAEVGPRPPESERAASVPPAEPVGETADKKPAARSTEAVADEPVRQAHVPSPALPASPASAPELSAPPPKPIAPVAPQVADAPSPAKAPTAPPARPARSAPAARPVPTREKSSLPPWFQRDRPDGPPMGKPWKKVSRRTPGDQTRLYINIGAEMGVGPGDVVGAILGETGLPAQVVGVVDIRERHLFVDVASEHANGIIAKMKRASIRGHKLKVKLA